MASIITIDSVTKRFGTTMAIRNLSLEMEQGTIFALLGPNGAGKTTTVRLLNGILTPNQGSMQVLDYDVTMSAHTIRNRCGVQTDTNLYEKLTAEDNLAIWGGFFGLQGNALRSRIEDLLEMFDLTHRKEDLVGTFSEGMRQKLSIARALIHNPELLFLDEPTAGLDPEASHEVLQYLESSNISDPETLLAPLINDLEQLEKDCFLVLDDYHEIDTPEIHTALKLLLTHLPEHVHVVLVTRVDPAFPISQFRVSGELVEIREESLRFTHEEVGEFLRKQGMPEISEESIRLLSERTEGWVAGLQLASLSLKQSDDPDRFFRHFSGQTGFILDYLMEEVLSRQSEDLQSFLVQMSILQRLHPDLCRAVTGMEHAGRLLQEVA